MSIRKCLVRKTPKTEEMKIDMPPDDKILMMHLISGSSKKGWLGITKLQKLSYLVEFSLSKKDERAFSYEFFVHDQGPMSKQVYDDLESLIDNGLVIEDEKGIRLGGAGEEIRRQFQNTIPQNISQAIYDVINECAHLKTHALVDKVHKMKVKLPNGDVARIEDLPRYFVILPNCVTTKLYKLGKDYVETFRVLSDQSLRDALKEAREKGSKCSEYKPLVSSS